MRWLWEKFLKLFRHRYKKDQHVYVWSFNVKGAGKIVDLDRHYPDYLVQMYDSFSGGPVWVKEEEMCLVRQSPSRRAKIKRSIFFKVR